MCVQQKSSSSGSSSTTRVSYPSTIDIRQAKLLLYSKAVHAPRLEPRNYERARTNSIRSPPSMNLETWLVHLLRTESHLWHFGSCCHWTIVVPMSWCQSTCTEATTMMPKRPPKVPPSWTRVSGPHYTSTLSCRALALRMLAERLWEERKRYRKGFPVEIWRGDQSLRLVVACSSTSGAASNRGWHKRTSAYQSMSVVRSKLCLEVVPDNAVLSS